MATKTRAELIALLKSRGIKGRLSKMTKAQLLAKVKATAPPEKAEEKPQQHMSGLRLEEADEQEGGHRFNMKGEVNKSDAKKAKHTHVKSSWPAVAKPKKVKKPKLKRRVNLLNNQQIFNKHNPTLNNQLQMRKQLNGHLKMPGLVRIAL